MLVHQPDWLPGKAPDLARSRENSMMSTESEPRSPLIKGRPAIWTSFLTAALSATVLASGGSRSGDLTGYITSEVAKDEQPIPTNAVFPEVPARWAIKRDSSRAHAHITGAPFERVGAVMTEGFGAPGIADASTMQGLPRRV